MTRILLPFTFLLVCALASSARADDGKRGRDRGQHHAAVARSFSPQRQRSAPPQARPNVARPQQFRARNFNPDVSVRSKLNRASVPIRRVPRQNVSPAVPATTTDQGAVAAGRRFGHRDGAAGRNRGGAFYGREGRRFNPDGTRNTTTTRNDGTVRNWGTAGRDRGGNHNMDRRDRGHRHEWNRNHRDRSWWRSHYNRFALFGGGYYYWDAGYWYPAYGYDPYLSTYAYDAPIYGYDNLEPAQVIANVQAELLRLGYDPGSVDGEYGPATRQALLDYQRDNGLPVTGEIDEDTLNALGFQ